MWTHPAVLTCLVSVAASALGAGLAPNPSFEQGDVEPLGWRLEGKGAWEKTGRTGERCISVTGEGKGSSFWRTTDLKLAPGALYRVAFWVKGEGATGGCVIAGPSFTNRDFRPTNTWERHAFVFLTPNDTEDAYLRFGHWEVKGKVLFDDIELKPTQAVHERFGPKGAAAGGAQHVVINVVGGPGGVQIAGLPGQQGRIILGEGEEITGNRYVFTAPLAGEGANHSRPLHTFRCGFNSNRWCFDDKSEVVYRHAIDGHRLASDATIEANCGYHVRGKGFIDVGDDGVNWETIASFEKVGRVKAEVPKRLLPANALYVRFRADEKAVFQIDDYSFASTLDADLGEMRGSTAYLDIQTSDPAFPVTVLSVPSTEPGSCWSVVIKNLAGVQPKFALKATVTDENGREVTQQGGASASASVSIAIGGPGGPGVPQPIQEQTTQMSAGGPLRTPGNNTLTLVVTADGREVFKASALRKLPVLHDASYGYALPSDPTCPLWWCEGPYKVSRTRPLPTVQRSAIELAAPRHDYEPFQLVLHPKAELKNVRVQVSPLRCGDATLVPEHIRIERVEYVRVTRPTDAAGVRGWWPDPLPPFEQGTTLAADRNHPLWFTVYVPPDQPAGEYAGTIELSADGWKATVPLKLRIYDFALPKTTRLQSGFGLDVGNIRRYHNLETDAELRQVLDLYFANFVAHRIAPYNPAPLDPFKVEFSTKGELKATIDFTAYDRQCEKWLAEGGFNSFEVNLRGMGGGTFHSRHPGRIGDFAQGTPEYEKLMASQGSQIVEHLKAKGWLEKAYTYWFDEPEPRDYEFVIEGMKLIKRVAPGLTRMLTEQPEPPLFGHVDLWCPVVSAVKPEAIAERRKAGERFWWYLCCGPHAPYIGLFIDHPAVDLRVWAWLSRKWGVQGHLVWQTNYWTSPTAFPPPDIQNPWADPMSYVTGYGSKPGQIGYWGNGDGRFLYPPNRDPKNDKNKYRCGPINSIRWEMLREGVEDYELFCLLDDLIAKAKATGKAADLLPEAEKLAIVPDAVIKDDKTYSKDPQPLLGHRRATAEIVEKLTKVLR